MSNESLRTDDSVDSVLQQYSKMVYRLAFSYTKNRADSEDVLQDVFTKYIIKHITYNSEEHRKAWLIRVTINCCRSLLTSSWYKKTTSMTDDLSSSTEEKSSVFYAVMELPQKQRASIHLFYYEGFSVKEISKLTGWKESTVKSHLFRARETLKETLKGEFCNV